MPELPEVKTVCKYLQNRILSKKIIKIKLYEPKALKNFDLKELDEIKNEEVKKIWQIAKYIVINTTNYNFVIHLRMEGKFVFSKNLQIENHKVLLFEFDDFDLLLRDHRKFATVNIYPNTLPLREQKLFKNVGQEPEFIDREAIFSIMKKRRISIKTFLLDQRYLAGIGNIYADEILYYSKIHPLRLTNQISFVEFNLIVDNAIWILEQSFKFGGSTIKTFSAVGHIGKYQDKLIVHQNFHKNCPNCGAKILKIKVNGRGTYFCPKEQI